ncbi:hypothetical protein J7T55_010755 [Diaporthe amygdali]|uniref:uncharacterized protein n=1 Tax=Phomopsis amygdali TaxID=1214568 RepID=UPI0022FE5510|nr:uncharacterized protein J7T55_010755 [Diaporthe amygdali]KAJ0114366.1 hypothetical protein J7T55_010755 [Diaporthe amygdali]
MAENVSRPVSLSSTADTTKTDNPSISTALHASSLLTFPADPIDNESYNDLDLDLDLARDAASQRKLAPAQL